MSVFLAQILPILLSYGTGTPLYPIACELSSSETAFDTNVHVEASVSYPKAPETSPFAHYVNEVVRKEAHAVYDTFVQEMTSPQEELWEEDGEDRVLDYNLHLVHSTNALMSFYGSEYTYRGGAHGGVQYITKTFWGHDGTIRELSLDDLFLPHSREWLFRYCENHFKSNRCGYYSDDDFSWVGFNLGHLDAFLLTETGLLLVFQNYTVSGYEDDPITLLIPYSKLVSIANPDGPLLFYGAKMVHRPSHLTCFIQ